VAFERLGVVVPGRGGERSTLEPLLGVAAERDSPSGRVVCDAAALGGLGLRLERLRTLQRVEAPGALGLARCGSPPHLVADTLGGVEPTDRRHGRTLPADADTVAGSATLDECVHCVERHASSAIDVHHLELAGGDELVRERSPDRQHVRRFRDRQEEGFGVEERRLFHALLSARGRSGGGAFSRPVCAATMRAGADIAAVEWRGVVWPVSPSGFAVVVWRGRRAPTVVGLDIDGKAVAEAALGLGRSPLGRLPLSARIARTLTPQPGPDDWFNYTPRP
jgi:hypothetical protein